VLPYDVTNDIKANLVTPYGAGVLQCDVNPNKDVSNLSGGDFDTLDHDT
jgi:hypothetical protein